MSGAASRPPPVLVDPEALAVALAVAPGVYSRNKMFAFFKDPRMAHARARARLVRAMVQELARAIAGGRPPGVRCEAQPSGRTELSYELSALRYSRTVELSSVEMSTVRYLLDKAQANCAALACSDADRSLVESTLRRLGE